jgi:hypothetical protein
MRASGWLCVTRNQLERVIEPRIPFPPARIAVSDGGAGVRRKGCGIRGAVARICGLSAECGSKVLVFDLQAVFCKVRGLRGLFSYFF